MSTWPAPVIRTDPEFEEAFSLFVHLQENASSWLSLTDRLTLIEAFEEFTDYGQDQVGQLFAPDVAEDPRAALNTLERRLGQLVANATTLRHTLRYTRVLDLVRTITSGELR